MEGRVGATSAALEPLEGPPPGGAGAGRPAMALPPGLLEALPQAILAFDAEERLSFVNPAFASLFPLMAAAARPGAALQEILRHGVAQGQFPEAGTRPETQLAWLAQELAAHRNPGPPREVALAGGGWVEMQEHRSPDGQLICLRSDITRRRMAEDRAQRHAEEDPLTGLGNREALFRKLAELPHGRRGRDPRSACLLLFDLDDFKATNANLGHAAGDALLVEIARRGRALLRGGDVFARLGGDEFAILLHGIGTPAQAMSFIGRLRVRLEQALTLGAAIITPSLSLGVALFPEDGEAAGALFRGAETALYQAKRQGRHGHSFFDRSIAAMLDHKARLTQDLRAAIAAEEITIALQPQLRTQDGRHLGFEALARWPSAAHPVPPSEFIPVAEEMGLMIPLSRLVLRRALEAMRSFDRLGLDPGRIAVNVATEQLLSEDFPREVQAALQQHGLPPQRLEIELTETTLLDRSADRIVQVLREFDAMGVSIALDDFGTGYASLAHLTQFPVHRLKIDRRLVRSIESGDSASLIARTVIGLAHGLGLEAVAEGVETPAQWDYLRKLGCDVVQGFLPGAPFDVAGAAAHLRAGLVAPAG
jgi:diguanylate cyclase (GGDEF)-like protein